VKDAFSSIKQVNGGVFGYERWWMWGEVESMWVKYTTDDGMIQTEAGNYKFVWGKKRRKGR
jgi:hypothetical protein